MGAYGGPADFDAMLIPERDSMAFFMAVIGICNYDNYDT